MGQLFWFPNCPALDGDGVKTRPVIVMTPSELIDRDDSDIIIVACTTRGPGTHADAIQLPNSANHPHTTSGLKQVTWAIPKWFFPTTCSQLGPYIASISHATLKRVALALEKRMADPL